MENLLFLLLCHRSERESGSGARTQVQTVEEAAGGFQWFIEGSRLTGRQAGRQAGEGRQTDR